MNFVVKMTNVVLMQGIDLVDTLKKDQKLPELLITPSTKGILVGIPNVPEQDDVNVARKDIVGNHKAFGFASPADVSTYEKLLTEGFGVISDALEKTDQIFVDTKFEFGYAKDASGKRQLIYMDEVGTPDSSRCDSGLVFLLGFLLVFYWFSTDFDLF